jgi:hypothetical protein
MLQRSIAALDERKESLIGSNDSLGKGGGGGPLVPGLSQSAMRKVHPLLHSNCFVLILISMFLVPLLITPLGRKRE